MPVAVMQAPEKKDPLDTVLKGLQIAGSVYGIREASAKLEEIEAAKQQREDTSSGVIAPKDEAALVEKGFMRVPEAGSNTIAMKRPDGSPVYFQPPKAKAELMTPYQAAQIKLERDKLNLSREEKTAKATPKSYDDKLKSLNATDRARYDNVIMATKAAEDMGAALQAGNNTFSIIGDNEFTIAERDFSEALGRMQSGGAITDDEAAKFMKMAPKFMDSDEIRQSKLARIKSEMESRLATLGFSGDEIPQLANRKSTPKSQGDDGTAIAGPAALPKTVIQNGHTYYLNEKTGKYE